MVTVQDIFLLVPITRYNYRLFHYNALFGQTTSMHKRERTLRPAWIMGVWIVLPIPYNYSTIITLVDRNLLIENFHRNEFHRKGDSAVCKSHLRPTKDNNTERDGKPIDENFTQIVPFDWTTSYMPPIEYNHNVTRLTFIFSRRSACVNFNESGKNEKKKIACTI